MIKQHDLAVGIYGRLFRSTFLSRYILLYIPVLAYIGTPQRISQPNRPNIHCAEPVFSGAVSSNYHVSGVSFVSRLWHQWHQWYIDIGFFENVNSGNCSEYIKYYDERSVGTKGKVSEHYTKESLKQFLELNGVQEWRLSDVSTSVAVFISRLMNLRILGRVHYIDSEGWGKVTVTLPHTTHCQICIRAPDWNCNVCRKAGKLCSMRSNTRSRSNELDTTSKSWKL